MQLFISESDVKDADIDSIIQPTRIRYNQLDLGPNERKINGIWTKRDDFNVQNMRNEKIQCSLYFQRESQIPIQNRILIIYLHGSSGSRLEVNTVINWLIPHNYHVCAFDAIGCGISDGKKVTLGLKEQDDLEIVIDHLKKQYGYSRIILWGRSMGAETALLFSISTVKQNINSTAEEQQMKKRKNLGVEAIVVDSAFSSFEKVCTENVEKKVSSFFSNAILKVLRNKLIKALDGIDLFQIDPLSGVHLLKIPAVFIYSEEDSLIHFSHSERLMEKYGGKYKKCTFQGNHNAFRDNECLEETIQFLKQNMVAPQDQQSFLQTNNLNLGNSRGIKLQLSSSHNTNYISNSYPHQSQQFQQQQYCTIPGFPSSKQEQLNQQPQIFISTNNKSHIRHESLKPRNSNLVDCQSGFFKYIPLSQKGEVQQLKNNFQQQSPTKPHFKQNIQLIQQYSSIQPHQEASRSQQNVVTQNNGGISLLCVQEEHPKIRICPSDNSSLVDECFEKYKKKVFNEVTCRRLSSIQQNESISQINKQIPFYTCEGIQLSQQKQQEQFSNLSRSNISSNINQFNKDNINNLKIKVSEITQSPTNINLLSQLQNLNDKKRSFSSNNQKSRIISNNNPSFITNNYQPYSLIQSQQSQSLRSNLLQRSNDQRQTQNSSSSNIQNSNYNLKENTYFSKNGQGSELETALSFQTLKTQQNYTQLQPQYQQFIDKSVKVIPDRSLSASSTKGIPKQLISSHQIFQPLRNNSREGQKWSQVVFNPEKDGRIQIQKKII